MMFYSIILSLNVCRFIKHFIERRISKRFVSNGLRESITKRFSLLCLCEKTITLLNDTTYERPLKEILKVDKLALYIFVYFLLTVYATKYLIKIVETH